MSKFVNMQKMNRSKDHYKFVKNYKKNSNFEPFWFQN